MTTFDNFDKSDWKSCQFCSVGWMFIKDPVYWTGNWIIGGVTSPFNPSCPSVGYLVVIWLFPKRTLSCTSMLLSQHLFNYSQSINLLVATSEWQDEGRSRRKCFQLIQSLLQGIFRSHNVKYDAYFTMAWQMIALIDCLKLKPWFLDEHNIKCFISAASFLMSSWNKSNSSYRARIFLKASHRNLEGRRLQAQLLAKLVLFYQKQNLPLAR